MNARADWTNESSPFKKGDLVEVMWKEVGYMSWELGIEDHVLMGVVTDVMLPDVGSLQEYRLEVMAAGGKIIPTSRHFVRKIQ